MAYAPGWQNDVFVSYARVDDQPLPGAEAGWVCTLVNALTILLAQRLGRAEVLAVWRDLNLRGNVGVSDAIFAAVRGSATLLIVLSEGYLASPWCNGEYNEFLALAGQDTRRVFVVEYVPIARSRKPAPLDDRIGYPFWIHEPARGRPRTLGLPVPTVNEPEYYLRADRLAQDLADELQRIKAGAAS